MSGGGKIIEKTPVTIEDGKTVVRYWLMNEYRPGWYDEICIYAEPSDDEPQIGETIWWGAERAIYFGPNDSKQLVRVGYSFSPERAGAR
jgi:hypothetical protein